MEKFKIKNREGFLELLIIIMLGVTAICTAWATWIGSLHDGNQAANFAMSNNLAAEGNSEWNAGIQALMQDMMVYNDVNNLMIDQHFADRQGNNEDSERAQWKIDELIDGNMSEDLQAALDWSIDESNARDESVSPFDKEGFIDTYFEAANELLAESEAAMDEGRSDGSNSDGFGLVTVIYAVALFLMGVAATLKNLRMKTILFAISVGVFLFSTIYMITLPLPTGFGIGGGA